jgi:hypothetical protein
VNDDQCFSTSTTKDGECTWIYLTNDEEDDDGSCIAKNNTDVECEYINRTEQCEPGGGITKLSETCTWIYSTNDEEDDNGSCIGKNNTDVECEYINRTSQCESGGGITKLSGTCSWIYSTNDGEIDEGICIGTNKTDVECEYINRTSQCVSGGGITSLADKCGLYNNECKTLCSRISETICKDSRSSDCFWIEENGTEYSGGCVDQV